MMATKYCQPSTFSSNYLACADLVTTKTLSYWLPVTICSQYPLKNASIFGTFHSDKIKMLLVSTRM